MSMLSLALHADFGFLSVALLLIMRQQLPMSLSVLYKPHRLRVHLGRVFQANLVFHHYHA